MASIPAGCREEEEGEPHELSRRTARMPYLNLGFVESVRVPAGRIIDHVFPDPGQIVLAPNDMVVIAALPDAQFGFIVCFPDSPCYA